MFIGHFAVGFGAKKYAPRTSVALLLAAAMFPDILWPIFLLLGWERVRIAPGDTRFTPLDLVYYPWSHSLLMCLAWGTVLAFAYYLFSQYWSGTLAIWIGVLSHWVLDWVSHRPDMPLYPGGPRYGLGLWNSVSGTLGVELALFCAGVWLYFRATRSHDRIGRYAFWAYVVLLLVLYIGGRFSPLPAGTRDIAWSGIIAIAVLIPWAWWFDRHRFPRFPSPS
jgi:LexA-binding, inner membrane-associated putative hydrolase